MTTDANEFISDKLFDIREELLNAQKALSNLQWSITQASELAIQGQGTTRREPCGYYAVRPRSGGGFKVIFVTSDPMGADGFFGEYPTEATAAVDADRLNDTLKRGSGSRRNTWQFEEWRRIYG